MGDLPLPPAELARRVGILDQNDPLGSFDAMGVHLRETILNLQGADWFSGGKRVLDFGCGSGKLLRHFVGEAKDCEFIGCDIDQPSINWLREHFSPPLTLFVCRDEPGLPLPDDHVDLALAISVFTHLTKHWAGWLLEIHRVLRPGGRFICTFLGRGMAQAIAGDSWNEDRIGMNIRHPWRPWSQGGPSVQHSEWWLRAHWGRAFQFERVEDSEEFGHGLMVLRKRDVDLTEENLREPELGEVREVTAMSHNVAQLTEEAVALGRDSETAMSELDAVRADRELVIAELDAVSADCQEIARQLEGTVGKVSELEAQIAEMRSTAAWRWAIRYWQMRARLRQTRRSGGQ